MAKKVGILGSGSVAQVLATGFITHGFDVMVGTRDSSKLKAWNDKNPRGTVGSFEDAVAFGEIVVLAVKGTAAEGLVTALASKLAGKTVIDTTNPIVPAPPVNGVLKYFTTLDESLMERLQRHAGEARFVKAFSIVGNESMVNPVFPAGKPTMFICGNDEAARKEVAIILDKFGWDVCDMGKAEAARAIEPLCMLWCIPGMIGQPRNHALKLIRK